MTALLSLPVAAHNFEELCTNAAADLFKVLDLGWMEVVSKAGKRVDD